MEPTAKGVTPTHLFASEDAPMTKFLSKFAKDESGATAIEYGLIAALIAVVIIGTVTALGEKISAKFAEVTAGMK